MPSEPIKNLNHRRVCDLSYDHRVVTIKQGNCLTIITAGPDGRLEIAHRILAA